MFNLLSTYLRGVVIGKVAPGTATATRPSKSLLVNNTQPCAQCCTHCQCSKKIAWACCFSTGFGLETFATVALTAEFEHEELHPTVTSRAGPLLLPISPSHHKVPAILGSLHLVCKTAHMQARNGRQGVSSCTESWKETPPSTSNSGTLHFTLLMFKPAPRFKGPIVCDLEGVH